MPLAHIAQVVVKGKVNGQDYRNVLHFGSDVDGWDGDPNAILVALAAAVFHCFVTVLLPGLSQDISVESCTAKRIFPALTDEALDATNAGAGGIATHSLPSFCSSLIDIKTGSGGRRNRGRMFLPPPLEDEVAQSLLDADALNVLTQFCQCLVGKFVGAGATTAWRIGVLSRAAITGGSAVNVAFKEAKTLTPVALVAVQRRRKIGKGS